MSDVIRIKCWSCHEGMTLFEHGEAYGMCPCCGIEVDLKDYLAAALQENLALKAEAQALREEVAAANDRADTLEHRMMGMMTRHFAEAWSKRDTEKALDGYLSAGIAELERERDAALAEVARIKTIADNYYALCVEREQELAALRSHDFHGIIASTIGDNWREEVDAMRGDLRDVIGESKEVVS